MKTTLRLFYIYKKKSPKIVGEILTLETLMLVGSTSEVIFFVFTIFFDLISSDFSY